LDIAAPADADDGVEPASGTRKGLTGLFQNSHPIS
jgi:hypothetical protein